MTEEEYIARPYTKQERKELVAVIRKLISEGKIKIEPIK